MSSSMCFHVTWLWSVFTAFPQHNREQPLHNILNHKLPFECWYDPERYADGRYVQDTLLISSLLFFSVFSMTGKLIRCSPGLRGHVGTLYLLLCLWHFKIKSAKFLLVRAKQCQPQNCYGVRTKISRQTSNNNSQEWANRFQMASPILRCFMDAGSGCGGSVMAWSPVQCDYS